MRHLAKFRAIRTIRCQDVAIFDFSRWRPFATLDLQRFKILTICKFQRVNVRHGAKFGADRTIRCQYIAIFRFFKMAAVRHLRFSKVGNFNCHFGSKGECMSPSG